MHADRKRGEIVMEFLYYLQPKYDSRKSFYKKAKVYRDGMGRLLLMSYCTIVAIITDGILAEDGHPTVEIKGWYSSTTARHINDFLYQHGFPTMSKKEMERQQKS